MIVHLDDYILFSVVTCDAPPAVQNMSYSPDIPMYNYSDSITYTCDLGYNYVSGDMTRSCNEHAQWTGIVPACTSMNKFCKPLAFVGVHVNP